MALSKADYEKALGRSLSDPEYKALSGVSRAAPTDTDGMTRDTYGDANNSGAPMFAEAKKAAKNAKPVAAPTGTGTIEFMANTRQGVRPIKENITSPEDVDKYVAAGMITPAEGAAYKASKWPAPKPPQPLVSAFSGKGKKTVGAEMLAEDTAQASALKKADKEAVAWDPAGNLQAKFPAGTPMSVAGNGLPWNAPQGAPSASPVLPGAPAPTQPAPPTFASGMTAHEDEDDYGAVIADARKKWGL